MQYANLDCPDIIRWINYEKCTLIEYYPTLAIVNLVGMLHDSALVPLYRDIVQALVAILKTLAADASQYVAQVVPPIIRVTEECRVELRSFFLTQFAQLAGIVKQNLAPYTKSIFEFIFVSLEKEKRLQTHPKETFDDKSFLLFFFFFRNHGLGERRMFEAK